MLMLVFPPMIFSQIPKNNSWKFRIKDFVVGVTKNIISHDIWHWEGMFPSSRVDTELFIRLELAYELTFDRRLSLSDDTTRPQSQLVPITLACVIVLHNARSDAVDSKLRGKSSFTGAKFEFIAMKRTRITLHPFTECERAHCDERFQRKRGWCSWWLRKSSRSQIEEWKYCTIYSYNITGTTAIQVGLLVLQQIIIITIQSLLPSKLTTIDISMEPYKYYDQLSSSTWNYFWIEAK